MITVREIEGTSHIFTLTNGANFRLKAREVANVENNLISNDFHNAEKIGLITMEVYSPPTPETDPTITLSDGITYLYSDEAIETLTVTLKSNLSRGFVSQITLEVFDEIPSVNLTNTGNYSVKHKGDSSYSDLVITPSATSKTVTITFSYDGINMNVYTVEV